MIRYRLFHNPGAHFMRPARQGDMVIAGYEGSLTDRNQGDPRAVDRVYVKHNRDDRPDGRTAPSLSVGDIVGLSADDGATWTYWTVDNVGWQAIAEDAFSVHVGPYADVVPRLMADGWWQS